MTNTFTLYSFEQLPDLIINEYHTKSHACPIMNITIATNPIKLVIRDSTETLGRNFGKITIPPIIAPVPKEPNSSSNLWNQVLIHV